MADPRRRALVVDDDDGVREVIADALQLEGIDVATARGGSEALAALEEGCTPSVILLDLQMPGIAGERLIPRLREHPVSRGVAIVAMSASPDRLARIEGADARLPKPFDLDALLALVGRLSARTESALVLGVDGMDAEHREQVDLARALAETLAAGDARPGAAELLDRFAECTRRHFSNEATLMRGVGYPGLAEHLREHTRYVAELERWSGASRGAELTVGSAMALRDAIEDHIATQDRELARYVSSGAGGAPA